MALRDRDGLKLKIGDSYCIVVPDHDWTLKLGRGWYGIQGYPFGTRLVLGARSAMIPAPFPLVSRLGLALFIALGVFSCLRHRSDHEGQSDSGVPAQGTCTPSIHAHVRRAHT